MNNDSLNNLSFSKEWSSCPPSVSQAIQAINEAVDNKDSSQTLAALRSSSAGLYGVTSECAQTYQDDLFRIKEEKNKEGEMSSCVDFVIFGTKICCNI